MKKMECETCQIKGYSPEVCRLHASKVSKSNPDKCIPPHSAKRIGKTAVLGACAGLVVTIAGLAAAPLIGIKALLWHGAVTKMSAGGAVGAGLNVVRKWKGGSSSPEGEGKKNTLLPASPKG
jgi:hypothetical protein